MQTNWHQVVVSNFKFPIWNNHYFFIGHFSSMTSPAVVEVGDCWGLDPMMPWSTISRCKASTWTIGIKAERLLWFVDFICYCKSSLVGIKPLKFASFPLFWRMRQPKKDKQVHLVVCTEDGLETFLNKDKRKCTLKISFHDQHHHYHNPHQPGEDEEGRWPPEEDFDYLTIACTMFLRF